VTEFVVYARAIVPS